MILTVKDLKSIYPAKIPYTPRNILVANEALDALWEERQKQRDVVPNGSRSGSCKFASLLARSLFGGRLAGNANHVFVVNDGKIIDLNEHQSDVVLLGQKAHIQFNSVLYHIDYREALSSCLPRLEKYESWILEQVSKHKIAS
jgi:hypothetical protein